MGTHKDLTDWQKSMALAIKIYRVIKSFPKEELYGTTSQMRRAAVSVPSNIAEGYGRGHERELLHFLYISLGSASELDTQLILCKEVEYITEYEFEELSNLNNEIIKMLSTIINKKRDEKQS